MRIGDTISMQQRSKVDILATVCLKVDVVDVRDCDVSRVICIFAGLWPYMAVDRDV